MAVSDAVTKNIRPDVEEETLCFFWKLPLEVRDIIYELLYGQHERVRVIIPSEWETHERTNRRRSGNVASIRPFPNSVLSDMLVSKQYMDEAIRVYPQNKTFVFTCPSQLSLTLTTGCAVNRYVLGLARSLSVSLPGYYDLDSLANFSRLTTIEVGIEQNEFETDDKIPGLHEYSDLDLVKVPVVGTLLKLRGLTKIRVDVTRNFQFGVPNKIEHENILRLKEQVQRLVSHAATQPKTGGDDAVHPRSVHELLRAGLVRKPGASRSRSTKLSDNSSTTLTAEDVPQTEADFTRLFFSDPHALWNCFREAMRRLDK